MKWPEYHLAAIADVTMEQSPPGKTYNEDGDGLPFFQGKAQFVHIHPTLKKWCSTPSIIARQGDYNLAAGRYKPQIAEKAPDEDPAELIREVLAIERETAAGLEERLKEIES